MSATVRQKYILLSNSSREMIGFSGQKKKKLNSIDLPEMCLIVIVYNFE